MKYAIVIVDGAADLPLAELGGRTPLQAADKPTMDAIAASGRIGTVRNVPEGFPPGSDVAILSVLGYDPRSNYTGRAPLEAAAQNLAIEPGTWVFRCNLVTIVDGIMADYSAGHISTAEATTLIVALNKALGSPTIAFHPGVSYRHLMTCRGEVNVSTTPPHDILGEPAARHLPTGAGSDVLRDLMDRSRDLLAVHEINAVRADLGENVASSIWLWGEGTPPVLEPFARRFGLSAAVITAVDLVRGIAALTGMDRIEVPGATGYVDTNYDGKGLAAVEALDTHDLVVVHVEAPDECAHNAQVDLKIQAIEDIDRRVVAPILRRLRAEGDDWRILVLPDHPTPCSLRTHTADPVPFAIAGKDVRGVVTDRFDEAAAAGSDLHIQFGHEMMEYLTKPSRKG
ncbi:MAG: cofactor-independent phosphoglycerate mutase [Planctomycetes bacterium]|nr:cofactor-independent phosphoglycerate mutase [Planctomycetota bacterium]